MHHDNILYSTAVWLVPLVIAIVFHEVAHGWAALAFGDTTAAERGRLSFNPIRHVDPVGTVILPLLLAIGGAPTFGWAKPVPVVAARMRNPRVDMMLVALAGPAMNLGLALVGTLALGGLFGWLGDTPPTGVNRFLVDNLLNFLLINVFLALFNLLPLPPFDGGHVVEGLLPRPLAAQYAKIGRFGFVILLVLLVVVPTIFPGANLVQRVVVPPAWALAQLFLGLAGAISG